MNDLNEGHVLMMRAVEDYVSARVPVDTLNERERAAASGSTPQCAEMADLRWLGLTVPEALGGPGGSIINLELVTETVGSVPMGSPFIATAAGAATVLVDAAGSRCGRG